MNIIDISKKIKAQDYALYSTEKIENTLYEINKLDPKQKKEFEELIEKTDGAPDAMRRYFYIELIEHYNKIALEIIEEEKNKN